MKFRMSAMAVALCVISTAMAMPKESAYNGDASSDHIRIYPEAGSVDSLSQITVATDDPQGFGAFVYMPSLYALNEDGSLKAEVSACELIDASARGKKTLEFKVLNPPTRSGKYAFLIKDNSFSLNSDERIETQASSITSENLPPDSPTRSGTKDNSFKNFPVNLESDTLRILHISNSYGANLLYYIDGILNAANVDLSKVLVERLVYSGGSFKNWVDVNNDKNTEMYWYFKMAGELNTNTPGWEGERFDGSRFRMILNNPWDLIVLNQASHHAPYYERWDAKGDGGYLPELLSIIREYHPSVPIGFLLIHSYAENYNGNSQHWTTTQRWERICNGVNWLKAAYNVDFIIPYGTAIENLRHTQFNTPHDLTGDGVHLASGLAKYTAGCCYFQTVFSPRCKQDIWGNSLRELKPEVQSTDKYEDEIHPIDDTSAAIAQKAAFLACHNMYEIRNPNMANLTEYQYGEVLNQEEYCFTYEFNGSETVDSLNSASPYCIYGPTGILIGNAVSEDEWQDLPQGLYIRNGKKIYKAAHSY